MGEYEDTLIFLIYVITRREIPRDIFGMWKAKGYHGALLLGVERDYHPYVQMSFFSWVWTPYSNGGLSPPTIAVGDVQSPLGGGSGATPPKGNF